MTEVSSVYFMGFDNQAGFDHISAGALLGENVYKPIR
jgi:hypothetical protein